MRAWVQAQKAGPQAAPEPWPEWSGGIGAGAPGQRGPQPDGARAPAVRDPFAPLNALGGASAVAAPVAAGAGRAAGPAYLGLLRRGGDLAAVVRTGDSVELVRVGQGIGTGGARVAAIGLDALTLHGGPGGEARGGTGQGVQRLLLEQDGMR